MKLKYLIITTLLCLFPWIVKAETPGIDLFDLTQNINVALDCDKCFLKNDINVKFQLFVGDEAIEGYELVLNKDNNYKGVFSNIPVYDYDTGEEIPFSVKYYDNGNYLDLEDDEIASKMVRITKWVQVLPENITENHDYVLLFEKGTTQKNNEFEIYALNYDLSTIKVDLDDYRVYSPTDGTLSLYTLLNDPPASTIWRYEPLIQYTRTKLRLQSSNESKYGYFKNYNDEYLSLVGGTTNFREDFYFTHSTKLGWVDSEQSLYEKSLKLTSNMDGAFTISSNINWYDFLPSEKSAALAASYGDYDIRYLRIDDDLNANATENSYDATYFVAFEKVENKEYRLLDLQYTKKMCTGDETEITLKVNSSQSLTTIFDDMDDLDLVRDCVIEDETIAKIEDGKIIPLAVGKTDIIVNYKDNQYRIILNVTEDDLIHNNESDIEEEPPIENPHTGATIPIVLSVLIIGAGIVNLNKKKYFIK